MMSTDPSRASPTAVLIASVDLPTPPLLPTKDTTRPTAWRDGACSGSSRSTSERRSVIDSGRLRKSFTPERKSSTKRVDMASSPSRLWGRYAATMIGGWSACCSSLAMRARGATSWSSSTINRSTRRSIARLTARRSSSST